MKNELTVHVLMRASKKTGKVDMCMTGLGTGLLSMWALRNTTPSKMSLILERDSGKVVLIVTGRKDFPKVEKSGDLGTCEDFGFSLEDLHSIKDDRFDKED